MLRNSDLVFGTITDENNNLVELTNSNYSKYIESQNREVRKQAFMTLYKGYESVKTLCQKLYREVDANQTIADIRGFNSALEMALFDGNIDNSIYYNLIEVVNKNLKVFAQILSIEKRGLKCR